MIVSAKEYSDITGCSSGLHIPDITVEEAQQWLIDRGYEIKIQKALAKVEQVEMGWNEVIRTGKYEDMERKRIIAIKPGDIVPERVDESGQFDFRSVFLREFKKKLLSI